MPIEMQMLHRLRLDPGTRTIGELLQEREWALYEIERFRRIEYGVESTRPRPSPRARQDRAQSSDVEHQYRKKTTYVTSEKLLLRLKEVCQLVGLSRATIYLKMSRGEFPESVAVGPRGRRWRTSDIDLWQSQL
jgi:prophage regulatory protein